MRPSKSMYMPAEDDRHYTDKGCCALFILCLVSLGYIGTQIAAEGNVQRLYHGYNYAGLMCGVDEQVKYKPYQYFPLNATGNGLDTANPICVAQCPDAYALQQNVTLRVPTQTVTGGQTSSGTDDSVTVTNTINYRDSVPYESYGYLGAYCKPVDADLSTESELATKANQAWSALPTLARTLADAKYIISGSIACAFGLGFLYMWLVGRNAYVICMTFFGLSVAGLLVFTFMSYNDKDPGSFVPCVVALLIVAALSACFCSHTLGTAARVVEAASETIDDLPKLVLVPVIQLAIQLVLIGVFLWGLVGIASLGSVSKTDIANLGFGANGSGTISVRGMYRTFHYDPMSTVYFAVWVCGFIWTFVYVHTVGAFVLSHSAAEWYFTLPLGGSDDREVACTVGEGYCIGFTKHMGSLAMAALMHLIVGPWMPLARALRNIGLTCGPCGWCLKHGNPRFYAELALNGKNYGEAADTAREQEKAGGVNLSCVGVVVKVFGVVGVVFIAVVNTGIALAIIHYVPELKDLTSEWYIESPTVALAFVLGISVLIGTLVMQSLDSIADTILYCFFVESAALPYGASPVYCPSSLQNEFKGYGSRTDRQKLIEMA